MSRMHFQYKPVDEDGDTVGWTSKNGTYDGDVLALESQNIPVDAILRATYRFNRLAIVYLGESDWTYTLVLEITSPNLDQLAGALNADVSRQIIELRRQALAEEGRESELEYEECPHCRALIDLTGLERTEECYCTYCETIFDVDAGGRQHEREYAICDECGYFARPREFTAFYFYFLLIIYGWRYQKKYMCSGCMRGEAWKMFAANLLFLIGVPVALYQLGRAYFGNVGGPYEGLAAANAAAQGGSYQSAAQQYDQILERGEETAGVHYNAALNALDLGDFDRAVDHVERALELCSNHEPTHDLVEIATEYGDADVELPGDEDEGDAMDRDLEDDMEAADVHW